MTEPDLCGNGMLDPGEECDEGDGNGPGMCTTWCMSSSCGDGEVASEFEECDDGDANGLPTSDCTSECKKGKCDDGEVSFGEECDDGIQNNGPFQFCLKDCVENTCGDGKLSPDEECDIIVDPNDVCDESCELAWCGDGEYDPDIEQCDGSAADMEECLDFCMYEPMVEIQGPSKWFELGEQWTSGELFSCGGNSLVAGVFGSSDPNPNPEQSRITKLGAICGDYGPEEFGKSTYIVTGKDFTNKASVGEDADEAKPFFVVCPVGRVPVGIGGSLSEGEFETLFFWCSRVLLYPVNNEWGLHMSEPLPTALVGVELDELPQVEPQCPSGQVVTEIKVAVGEGGGIQTIKIGCQKIAVI
ncbi:MAG TPA: hypothetical protein ENJ18_01300 [Nannocystis exedens]|nr:hypothetical protein [Nannocystis exedens]